MNYTDEKSDLEEEQDKYNPLGRPKSGDDKFDELADQGFSPEEIAEMEDRAYDGAIDDRQNSRSRPGTGDDEEDEINRRIADFYKDNGADAETVKKSPLFAAGSRSRKAGIIAGTLGVPSLIAVLAFLPGLLGIFKVQNFFENINSGAFLRMNAAFENRSDKWLKSYIKLRLTEIDNPELNQKDSLFFRSDKVDTDNPIKDWYRTMRASKFEEDLKKQGIVFSSAINKDPKSGRVTFAFTKITIKDQNVDFNLSDGGTLDISTASPTEISSALNRIDLKMSDKIDAEIISGPGSNKKARGIIKKAVNDNTKSWQVFHRRKIRKSIQNQTGVSDWRLFESTRDKVDAKKKAMFDRIMNAVLPDNRTGKFVACLFGAGACPSNVDPASSDSRNASTLGDQERLARDDEETEVSDENGTSQVEVDPETGTPSGNATTPEYTPESAAGEVAEETSRAVTEATDDDLARAGAKGLIIKEYIQKFIGDPYTKVWSFLKKIAKIHKVLANNELGKLVIQARRMQYMAAFTMAMAVPLSQMKAGDIKGTETDKLALGDTGDSTKNFAETVSNNLTLSRDGEVNQFLNIYNNAERSEAWMLFNGSTYTPSTASAAAISDPGRNSYCDMNDKEKKQQPVYYRCPDDGITDGKAGEFSDAYKRTVGKILGPIAEIVDSIDNSIFGKAFNWVSGFAGKISDATLGKAINYALDITGGKEVLEGAVTVGVTKAVEYAGAGAKYTPDSPGQLNYFFMGGAATAEVTARENGAAKTSSLVGLKEYSSKLALDWQNEKKVERSTWNKYFAISNPKSLLSSALMAVSTSSPGSFINSAAKPTTGLNGYAGLVSGQAFAAENNSDPHAISEWTGVDTYDFPQECIDLDPLSFDYLSKATNAPVGVPRTYDVLGDANTFWDAVYANLDGDSAQKEASAASVYNCVLLDRSVRGGLGYVYGYTDDGGYENSPGTPGSFGAGVANLNCEGYKRFDSEPAVIGSSGVPVGEFTVPYSAAEKTLCQSLKSECTAGVSGIKKGLCAALEYDGVYYGSSAKPEKNMQFNGFHAKTNALHNPVLWTQKRQPGLNPYNVLECSALTTIAVYRAFGHSTAIGCSGMWSATRHPSLFQAIPETDVQPGDFLTTTNECNVGGDASSHIAVAASAPDSSGNLIIYESSSWQTTTHFREVNMSYFSGGHKSRWIGAGL